MTRPRPGWYHPKRAPQCLSVLVNVKHAQRGILLPLTIGENQRPAGVYTSMSAHSMRTTMTTLNDVKDMNLIAPPSPISEPGVTDEC